MININGYYLNERYADIVSLIRDLTNVAILARTKMEAKTILWLMRFIGVKHLVYDAPMSDHLEMNIPHKGLKNHMYQIQIYQNEPIVVVTPSHMANSSLVVKPTMRVKDIVVKKSLMASIRDLF